METKSDIPFPERAEIWLYSKGSRSFCVDLKTCSDGKLAIESTQEVKTCRVCSKPVKFSEKCSRCPEIHQEWAHQTCSDKSTSTTKMADMDLKDLTNSLGDLKRIFGSTTLSDLIFEKVKVWNCSICKRKSLLDMQSIYSEDEWD